MLRMFQFPNHRVENTRIMTAASNARERLFHGRTVQKSLLEIQRDSNKVRPIGASEPIDSTRHEVSIRSRFLWRDLTVHSCTLCAPRLSQIPVAIFDR